MNSILQLPLAQGLSWALIHFLWQGSLIALALAVSLPLLGSSSTRYAAACASMLTMGLAFAATWVYSIPGSSAAMPSALAGTAPTNLEHWMSWAAPAWATGVLLIGLYRIWGFVLVQRMRRRGVAATSPAWQERLLRLTKTMGLSKAPLLLECRLAEGPIVVGVLRPTIIFPIGLLSGMPVTQLEAILLHELAHIRRSDYLVNLVQALVESLLFYHPAIWWVSRLMRIERENCCDDVVVAVQGNPLEYASALLALEERRCAGLDPAPAATGGILMNRIHRLLHRPEQPRPMAGLILSLCLLISMFCMAGIAQQSAPADGQDPTPAWNKWLNEDVVYLIEDSERDAFERLQNDEERDRFVEQFWARRDLTPDTPVNERRDEHYRRIDYSNGRFTAAEPGWKTDRGRLYILYGPADEIESHPSGGEIRITDDSGGGVHSDNPFEIWRYHHVEEIGDDVRALFVDVRGSGDYWLMSGPAPVVAE